MKKSLLGIGAVLLCFLLGGFLLVPWVIKRQVSSRARSRLHREATLTAARFNPFTLETRLIGLDLRDDDGTPLFAFDTMVVNLSIMSVFHRAITLDEFRLVRPTAVARIDQQGDLAIADILAADSTAPKDSAATRPPRLEIRVLSIIDGTLDYIDESRSPRYEEQFTDLSLKVDGLSTLPNEKGGHVLTVNFASGAQVRWTGRNTFEPLDMQGEFEFSRVHLARLSQVFGSSYPLLVTRGEAGATLKYALSQGADRGLVLTVPSAALTITDLAASPLGISADWLRVPSLAVSGAAIEWPARIATIDRVSITNPWATAALQKDGSTSWTPVIAAFTDATGKGAAADSTPPWAVTLDQFVVTGGSASIIDLGPTPSVNYELTQLALQVTPVSSDPAAKSRVEASGSLGRRATFKATGDAAREPFSADLDVSAKGLDLAMARPYLGAGAPATIKSGTAAISGKVKLRNTRPTAVFDGRMSIAKFALDDSTKEPLLAWNEMRITGIHYTRAPDLLRIRQVVFDHPFARVAISRERTINLMSLTTMFPADTTAPPLKYEIGEVSFDNARIDFSDESLILPFRTNIDSAHGTIRDVASFGGAPGSLELEGKVEQYGIARASGVIYVNDPYASTDIKADFRNLDMKSFTPYSAQFAGYSIAEGRLDIDMTYRVRDRQLNAEHHIVATNLKLGDKVEGGESPGFLVKLAISLLKDKEGRIKLDVPVEGTVDDPQFSYKAIAWKAVKQILGKIATAPFRFLGKALGIGGGDDVDLVDFDPGRSDVIPPEQEKLDSLVAEMGRKPELTLAVEGRYDSISDAKAIREQKLDARVKASRDSLGRKAQSDTSTTMSARILESLYAGDHGKPALDSLKDQFRKSFEADTARKGRKYDATPMYAEIRTRLLAAESVEPAELVTLASARSTAIVTALTAASLDPARVSAVEPQPVSRKKSGSSRIPSELKMDAK